MQNYLQALWFLAISITNFFCSIADTDLTKLHCDQNWLARAVTKSSPLLAVFHCCVSFTVKFIVDFSVSLLTYKTVCEKEQRVYLYYMLATSLPSRSLRSNKGIILLVSRAKTSAGAIKDISLLHPFPLEQLPTIYPFSHLICNLQERLKLHLFDLPSLSLLDTSTFDGVLISQSCLINRFCCWTLIQLLRHWA